MENKLYVCILENEKMKPLFKIPIEFLTNSDTLFSQSGGGIMLDNFVASVNQEKMEKVSKEIKCEVEDGEETGGSKKIQKQDNEEFASVLLQKELEEFMDV